MSSVASESAPRQPLSTSHAYTSAALPVAAVIASASSMSAEAAANSPANRCTPARNGRATGSIVSAPLSPSESHHASGERMVRIVVPELEHGQRHDDGREGEPAHALFMVFERLVPEPLEREPKGWHTRGRSLREPACHPVEDEVDRAWCVGC